MGYKEDRAKRGITTSKPKTYGGLSSAFKTNKIRIIKKTPAKSESVKDSPTKSLRKETPVFSGVSQPQSKVIDTTGMTPIYVAPEDNRSKLRKFTDRFKEETSSIYNTLDRGFGGRLPGGISSTQFKTEKLAAKNFQLPGLIEAKRENVALKQELDKASTNWWEKIFNPDERALASQRGDFAEVKEQTNIFRERNEYIRDLSGEFTPEQVKTLNTQPSQSGLTAQTGLFGGTNTNTWIIVGGLAVAGLLLSRRR